MSDQIIRDDPKMQSKSLLPAREQHPLTLDSHPTSGLVSLNNKVTNRPQAVNQTGYLTGRVLANKCPPNSTDGKSKYRLPHLNMEPGQELEDYLVYVALDEPSTRTSTEDPEKIFLQMSKLTSGAQSKFEFDKNNPNHIRIWKKSLSSMLQHVLLAPKYTSSIVSSAPAPGTRVKVYLFQPHQVRSGTVIDGLYEKEYDAGIFNKGYTEMLDFFKGLNQKLTDAATAMEKAIHDLLSNAPQTEGGQDTQNKSGKVSETDAATSTAMNNTALRQYINSLSESEKYDYFSNLVPQKNGTFKTGLNEKNIIGFRTQTNTFINNKRGQYDDLFFLVWLDSKGNKKVGQYLGNTEPAAMWLDPEVNKNSSVKGLKSLSRIKAGFMTYVTYLHPKRGRILMLKPGTKQGVENDANNNGLFDDGKEKYGDPQMLFHPGDKVSTGSAGCQTMPGDVFNRFMNDVHSEGTDKQELGYTLIDENTITVPEPEMTFAEQPQNNPQETSSEAPIEPQQNQTSAAQSS